MERHEIGVEDFMDQLDLDQGVVYLCQPIDSQTFRRIRRECEYIMKETGGSGIHLIINSVGGSCHQCEDALCGPDEFCYGCGQFLCDGCNRNDTLMGSHDFEDHEEPPFEDYNLDDPDDDELEDE